MTTKSNSPAAAGSAPELNITRVFDAPRSLVFRAWTDSEHLARWWGPHGWTNPRCQFDARPGGGIFVEMSGPDGNGHPMGGTVKEVTAPERLVFTNGLLLEDGTFHFEVLNTVTFAEAGGKTTVTLHARILTAQPGFEQFWKGAFTGWNQSLEKLEDSLGPVRTITAVRGFNAPRELVWEAMTDPKQVVRWWGPRGFSTTVHEMDVRSGGRWTLTMRGPDGANYPNQCIFLEVFPPERLVFQNGGRREGGPDINFVSTWTFSEIEVGFTVVEIRMVFPTAEGREYVAREFKAVEGAGQTLERLGEHLVSAKASATRSPDC
jgi:uncharacterized protein YndB with AHSA1/START domain